MAQRRPTRIARDGRVYRFTINGTEYAAFVWAVGRFFCGRVDGLPQLPEVKARTAVAVRDELQAAVAAANPV